jgi:hypothetical protein
VHNLLGPADIDDATAGRLLSQDNIFRDGEWRDQHEMLVHHANAQFDRIAGIGQSHGLPVNADGTPVRSQKTIQDVDESGFAGAIFTNQRVNFPRSHGEVNVIIGQHKGKFFGNLTHVDGIVRHGTDSSV